MAKRNIKVREQELIDRLNNVLNPKKDSDNVIATSHIVWDPKTGRFVMAEGPGVDDTPSDYDNEKVVNGWEAPNEWKNIPEGEVRINLDPLSNIGNEWDEKHGIELTDDVKDWATRDCSQDARESRTGVANSILHDSERRKIAEDICYKRIKRNEPKIAALKKALDEYKDTQLRPLNTEGYEYVNHPQHYNNYDMEVIEMMEKIFGRQATKSFCLLNAFKYRMRAGTKPNIPAEQDLAKEQWYLNKAKELS